MRVIDTPQDLLKYIVEHDGPPNLGDISLGAGFIQTIVIAGPSWSGKMDYRAGQIILNAQKDLLKIVSEATGQNYTLNSKLFKGTDLLVTAEISNNCLKDILDFANGALEAIKNMESKDIRIVFIIGLSMCFAGYGFYQYNQTKIEMARIANEPKMQILVERGFDIADKALSVPRYIVSKMGEDDTVVVNDGPKLTKKEARAALPVIDVGPLVQDETPIWVDDVFEIENWGLLKADFTIKDPTGTRLNAGLGMMIPEEMAKLHAKMPTDMSTPHSLKIKLRVAVVLLLDKKVRSCFILQVDPQGGDNPTLTDLLTPDGD